MEPQIQYVRSADGTSIATASVGAGPVLVWMTPNTQMSFEGYFASPGFEDMLGLVAERFRVVMYDPRGLALSDRHVADLSLAASVADLTAVQESAADGQCNVVAHATSCPVAIAFAALYPKRVRRLLLWGGIMTGRDIVVSPRRRILAPLIDVDWELYCNTVALTDYGWTEHGRTIGAYSAKALDGEMFKRQWAACRDQDASEYAAQVRCPTLVVQPSEQPTDAERMVPFSAARHLAAVIPGARLRIGDGLSVFLSMAGPTEAGIVLDFLSEQGAGPDQSKLSGTAIILFADIVDSTALTERLGDASFRDRARALDDALRAAITAAGGTAIDGKLVGDGVLATFPAASQAIDAALRCAAAGNDGGLPLHLGIHAGDVIREQNNVYGGAVNIASRISALSAPGEVLVSDIVRGLARTSAGVAFDDRGEQALKGVADPQRVYAVRASPPRDGDGS
jgi:class 3 adenylate cyclase/pimeloyl-ACP methyl ester carboxylesterase